MRSSEISTQGPHYGVRLVLNVDSQSVVSRQLMEKSANEVITARMHSKEDRIRTKLRKPTQHFGTKHDSSVYSKAKNIVVTLRLNTG